MREGLHYDAHTPEMYAYRAEVKGTASVECD